MRNHMLSVRGVELYKNGSQPYATCVRVQLSFLAVVEVT